MHRIVAVWCRNPHDHYARHFICICFSLCCRIEPSTSNPPLGRVLLCYEVLLTNAMHNTWIWYSILISKLMCTTKCINNKFNRCRSIKSISISKRRCSFTGMQCARKIGITRGIIWIGIIITQGPHHDERDFIIMFHFCIVVIQIIWLWLHEGQFIRWTKSGI